VAKTSLALEYAHRHKGDFESVHWLPCQQRSLVQIAAELAFQLGLKLEGDLDAIVHELKGHCAQKRCLLVFDNVDVPDTTAGASGARELAGRISATWVAFARNGEPDNPEIPPWPAYTTEHRATMILDTACRIAYDPDHEMRLLWSRVVAGGN